MFVALTFYSLMQIPMNMAVIAAFLTILAYSINATIIIFDRVRENLKLPQHKGKPFSEIINISTSQTLARSINTTLTTLFVLLCVYIIGVPSIKAFVFPIIVGIGAGVFSSRCLAGTLWDLFDGLKNKGANKKKAAGKSE
jgi:preprotein translocase SecF subunit